MTGRLRVSLASEPETAVVLEPADRPTSARGSSVAAPPRSFVDELAGDPTGARHFEVVVDGWCFELAVEDAARAELRERATRGRVGHGAEGPADVRAIIPGRVVGVLVAEGQEIGHGQPVIVLEAMKMQNEIRAPRDGTVSRIAVSVGSTVEVGDRLLAIE